MGIIECPHFRGSWIEAFYRSCSEVILDCVAFYVQHTHLNGISEVGVSLWQEVGQQDTILNHPFLCECGGPSHQFTSSSRCKSLALCTYLWSDGLRLEALHNCEQSPLCPIIERGVESEPLYGFHKEGWVGDSPCCHDLEVTLRVP